MSDEVRKSSNVWRLMVVAGAIVRQFVMRGHRRIAAMWPHGLVDGSPAPQGIELDHIGIWEALPRPSAGMATAGDLTYREILKKPFSWHRQEGTEAGIIRAVEALGYTNVSYISWQGLTDCPTWTPPLAGSPVFNQNAFGVYCDGFPANWLASSAVPSGLTVADARMRSLIQAVLGAKRASAKFWEIRIGETFVVTQAWREGDQLDPPVFVAPQNDLADFVVVRRDAP